MAGSKQQRLAVVTGGKGGLGSALAKALADGGYQVAAPGREALDVTSEEQVSTYFADLPRVDVVVHNAGIAEDMLLPKMDAVTFQKVLDVHLRGGFLVARAALKPMMKARAGHLLFIGSRSARTGPRGQANYAAAKAGLEGLARSIALEYGLRGIRANVVLPGFMLTKMMGHLKAHHLEAQEKACALGRFNTPENAADFIAKIADLELVSGQTFTLDSRIDAWC